MITSIPNDQRDHQITRRDIILGVAASLICAPAIVRITNLMPVPPFAISVLGHSLQGSLNVYIFTRLRGT
jgi:hypothetical protein